MGISLYKIKKWYQMLTGQSIAHVNQKEGVFYSKDEVAGYYNDLTEKVTKSEADVLVPKSRVDNGEEIFFSIGIFQYGLGAYDLYLSTGDEAYKEKLLACADWAVENQQESGGFITFEFENPEAPYSSMAQGEGISMLIRAYKETEDERYLRAIELAKDFMLRSVSEGGTTVYHKAEVYLYERTDLPLILNGWIFSLWGLYDYGKFFGDESIMKTVDATVESLKRRLRDFDNGYWSKYDEGKMICSPFYHRLHIAQLRVMYDLFGDGIFLEYAEKWEGYQNSFLGSKKALVVKALQKIFERG